MSSPSTLDAVAVDISVVLGKTRMTLEDILNADPGTVVKLERMNGQPVDVLVNGLPFGKGELAVMGNNMAVRITELLKSK